MSGGAGSGWVDQTNTGLLQEFDSLIKLVQLFIILTVRNRDSYFSNPGDHWYNCMFIMVTMPTQVHYPWCPGCGMSGNTHIGLMRGGKSDLLGCAGCKMCCFRCCFSSMGSCLCSCSSFEQLFSHTGFSLQFTVFLIKGGLNRERSQL